MRTRRLASEPELMKDWGFILFVFGVIVVLYSFASSGPPAPEGAPIEVAPSPAEVVEPSSSAADVPDAAGL